MAHKVTGAAPASTNSNLHPKAFEGVLHALLHLHSSEAC
jgi:hypothetical protein